MKKRKVKLKRSRSSSAKVWAGIIGVLLFLCFLGILAPDTSDTSEREPTVVADVETLSSEVPTATDTPPADIPSPETQAEAGTKNVEPDNPSPNDQSNPDGYPALPEGLERAVVTQVIDGDTVDVSLNDQVVRLRLIGMDTPETVHPSKPVECFGREASDQAKAMLAGQSVLLETDDSQDSVDRYGRQLRYVWLPDGRLFNLEMIAQGYAFEYTYNVPHKYHGAFVRAEQAAREQQLGLWAPEACNGEQRPADSSPAAPQLSPTESVPTQPPPVEQPQGDQAENCDPSYPGVCIPPYPPDLDCGEITYRRFEVLQPDPHGFDRDKDGIGCES
jgi:micrococcal nuclease